MTRLSGGLPLDQLARTYHPLRAGPAAEVGVAQALVGCRCEARPPPDLLARQTTRGAPQEWIGVRPAALAALSPGWL